jgi:hypothetical protein
VAGHATRAGDRELICLRAVEQGQPVQDRGVLVTGDSPGTDDREDGREPEQPVAISAAGYRTGQIGPGVDAPAEPLEPTRSD